MQLSANLSANRYEWATEVVKNLLNNTPGAIYYDIGAGTYALAQKIAPGNALTKSFDLYPQSDDIQQWDIEEPLPYHYPQADIVTFLEIVEHLNNPWMCLKNISAIIKPGGHLILTTPNPGWSTSRINLLFKGFLACFTKSDLDLNHHVFTAWPHIVNKLLNDNQFQIVDYVTLDGRTHLFDKNIKPASALIQIPVRLIKKLIEKKDPTAVGMSYGIVARKI